MSGSQFEWHDLSALANSNRTGRIVLVVVAALVFGGRCVSTVMSGTKVAVLVSWRRPTLIGTLVAASIATILGGALRATDGPSDFEVLGLKIGGTCAAAILWIIASLIAAFPTQELW